VAVFPGKGLEGLFSVQAELGVEDIQHIPGDFPFTTLQARIRACLVNRKEFIAPEMADELRKGEYPVHFLDFDAVAPAIPRLRVLWTGSMLQGEDEGCSPFAQDAAL
jgi:hypothetical protein